MREITIKVGKTINVDNLGQSLLYLFYLNDGNSKSIKIGVATYSKTDKSIQSRRKYTQSLHPVTIERRISDLQTGNPLQIKPLAYFLYDKKEVARDNENKLQRHFCHKKHFHVNEWFQLTEQDIKDILWSLDAKSDIKIIDCDSTPNFWVEQSSHWKFK